MKRHAVNITPAERAGRVLIGLLGVVLCSYASSAAGAPARARAPTVRARPAASPLGPLPTTTAS